MSAPIGVNWLAIPEELRQRPQWCVAGDDKRPYILNQERNGLVPAKVNHAVFMTFEWAASVAHQTGNHIGYIITPNDPYCCIDLDVKDHTTQEEMQYYISLVDAFQSYSEFSRSGKGMHIWLRGQIGMGARLGGLEVYSQNRFIICTGRVHKNLPIEGRQDLLDKLMLRIRTVQRFNSVLEDEDEVDSDEDIFLRASTASNSAKFLKLCRGDWHGDYPSQSEADMALMAMFTFYSPSNVQCRRLFRMTALGQRDKAKRDKYLDYMIGMKRGQQAELAEFEDMVRSSAERMAQEVLAAPAVPAYEEESVPEPITQDQEALARAEIARMQGLPDNVADRQSFETAVAVSDFEKSKLAQMGGMPWPPGFAGLLASFLYSASPRPVKEIAIVATLGVLAGCLGRRFNVMGTGLNCYIVLVAKSGVGKEAMHSGIGLLMHAHMPLEQYVIFDDFASGPALQKAVNGRPSFVNVAGEFGRKLTRMANDGTEGPMHTLRTQMTHLYQKSGSKQVVGGVQYAKSNKDSDIAGTSGVAYSMIGESTPNTFFESLTNSMMEDGFLSRFTIIEYKGDRPPLNKDRPYSVPQAITEHLIKLAPPAVNMTLEHGKDVPFDPEADQMQLQYSLFSDEQVNANTDEGIRQMWNRAHLKVVRFAALLAAADNPADPVITAAHMTWSLQIVQNDITMMYERMSSGEVGMGDSSRDGRLATIVREYFQKPLNKTHERYTKLRDSGIIPKSYLQQRCQSVSAFSKFHQGYRSALDQTIRGAMDAGYLVELEKARLTEYGFSGKAYFVTHLP